MTKTYPEGTRWALRLHSGEMALWFCHDEISRHDRKARQTFATRAEAIRRLGCLNVAWTDAAVLVRIPPPRPKRSVEERIAAAVRERTEAIIGHLVGDGLGRALIKNGPAHHWLRDLRDGKVSA